MNGVSSTFSSGCQIQLARPFRITSSAIVAMTTVSSPPRWSGLITAWWIAAPPRKERTSVKRNAGQNDQPWWLISDQAM